MGIGLSPFQEKSHLGNFFKGRVKLGKIMSGNFLLAMFEKSNSLLFIILSLLFKV